MLCEFQKERKETKVIDKNPPGAADCYNMGSREWLMDDDGAGDMRFEVIGDNEKKPAVVPCRGYQSPDKSAVIVAPK